MKILQLTNKIPYPPKDGGALATLSLSMGFADLGHQVTILAMNTSKHFIDMQTIPQAVQQKVNIIPVFVDTKISIWKALKNLIFSDLPYNATRFFSSDYTARLRSLLQSQEFDIVQLEGLYLANYIQVIRNFSSASIVMRAHNVEHLIWKRNSRMCGFTPKWIYLNMLAKRIRKYETGVINKYDMLVPITDKDAVIFKELGNGKPCFVSPFGIETTKLSPNGCIREFPSVFFIGTLDWIPNQEGLMWFLKNVWAEVCKLHSDLKFFIAGRNAPDWLVKQLNLRNVVYLGEIDDAQGFINSYAIMVVPLFSGSGIRVKIIEGMALGKTIISTSVGIEGINATDEENIIIANDAAGFINQITRLAKQREVFDRIGKNAAIFAQRNFDNTSIVNNLIRFYSNNLQ